MAKRKSIPRKPLPSDAPRPQSEEMHALQKQVQHLQFEVDVLKETIAVLKKDPGVDLTALKNREEAVIIGTFLEVPSRIGLVDKISGGMVPMV